MMHDPEWAIAVERSRAENQTECNLLFAGIRARVQAMNHPPHSTDHINNPEFWRRWRQTGEDLSDRIVAELGLEPEPEGRTRVRKPSPVSEARRMKRAGFEIAGCEFNPRDGTFKLIFGKPVDGIEIDDATRIDRSEWN
jgi:hypothetical protein